MSIDNKIGLAVVGFVLGGVGVLLGAAFVSLLLWNFDTWGMFELRLALIGGIFCAAHFSLFVDY